MGKNKAVDPGLKYLNDIGFKKIRGKNGLIEALTKSFGKEKTEETTDADK